MGYRGSRVKKFSFPWRVVTYKTASDNLARTPVSILLPFSACRSRKMVCEPVLLRRTKLVSTLHLVFKCRCKEKIKTVSQEVGNASFRKRDDLYFTKRILRRITYRIITNKPHYSFQTCQVKLFVIIFVLCYYYSFLSTVKC